MVEYPTCTLPKTNSYTDYLEKIDWSQFKKWLVNRQNQHHAYNVYNYATKYSQLAFTQELVEMPPSRKRMDILVCISNLCRYLDGIYNTEFHGQFKDWLKKKELKWSAKPKTNTFTHAQRVKQKTIISSLAGIPDKECKLFAVYALVSGLRTGEVIQSIVHHEKLCEDNVMELFWDRGSKKANAVYCHPILHNLIINLNVPSKTRLYDSLSKKKLGFEIRMLRRVNFTINASKVDPLLAEFMQGRQGSISMQHYYLPYMKENYKKWIKVWTPFLKILDITNKL